MGRMQEHVLDITLKFTLSALWNLTDESPRTCKVFLDEDGMELFLEVLKAFPEKPEIETKVLGLLNNIAEVSWLRTSLLVEPFIQVLRQLLRSKSIEVSYFAAGIVAHLASDSPERWVVEETPKYEITSELGKLSVAGSILMRKWWLTGHLSRSFLSWSPDKRRPFNFGQFGQFITCVPKIQTGIVACWQHRVDMLSYLIWSENLPLTPWWQTSQRRSSVQLLRQVT